MTNTTELRKRFDTEVNKWLDPMSDYGGKELVDFLQSEIEQAERARTEEIIEWLEIESSSGDIAPNAHQQDCARFARILRSKFLTKPNHEQR